MTNKVESIQTLAQKLKLPAFAEYSSHVPSDLSLSEAIHRLLCIEYEEKERQRITRRTKTAGFPVLKTLDTFDWEDAHERLPHFRKSEVLPLLDGGYIEQRQNVVAIGNSGTGKSHLAGALGLEAIRQGYLVKFWRVSDLIQKMREAQSELRLTKLLKALQRCDLLIMDEMGYLSFDTAASSLLFQVFAARYETRSTFVTTNLEFSKWVAFLGDPTLATALVDRLVHRSVLLNMNGESYRLKHANL
jgi:DNA replication protein DnaC